MSSSRDRVKHEAKPYSMWDLAAKADIVTQSNSTQIHQLKPGVSQHRLTYTSREPASRPPKLVQSRVQQPSNELIDSSTSLVLRRRPESIPLKEEREARRLNLGPECTESTANKITSKLDSFLKKNFEEQSNLFSIKENEYFSKFSRQSDEYETPAYHLPPSGPNPFTKPAWVNATNKSRDKSNDRQSKDSKESERSICLSNSRVSECPIKFRKSTSKPRIIIKGKKVDESNLSQHFLLGTSKLDKSALSNISASVDLKTVGGRSNFSFSLLKMLETKKEDPPNKNQLRSSSGKNRMYRASKTQVESQKPHMIKKKSDLSKSKSRISLEEDKENNINYANQMRQHEGGQRNLQNTTADEPAKRSKGPVEDKLAKGGSRDLQEAGVTLNVMQKEDKKGSQCITESASRPFLKEKRASEKTESHTKRSMVASGSKIDNKKKIQASFASKIEDQHPNMVSAKIQKISVRPMDEELDLNPTMEKSKAEPKEEAKNRLNFFDSVNHQKKGSISQTIGSVEEGMSREQERIQNVEEVQKSRREKGRRGRPDKPSQEGSTILYMEESDIKHILDKRGEPSVKLNGDRIKVSNFDPCSSIKESQTAQSGHNAPFVKIKIASKDQSPTRIEAPVKPVPQVEEIVISKSKRSQQQKAGEEAIMKARPSQPRDTDSSVFTEQFQAGGGKRRIGEILEGLLERIGRKEAHVAQEMQDGYPKMYLAQVKKSKLQAVKFMDMVLRRALRRARTEFADKLKQYLN